MTEYCIAFLNIEHEREMILWAIDNCNSFSYRSAKAIRTENGYDCLYKFYFGSEKDAMWFRLHWS